MVEEGIVGEGNGTRKHRKIQAEGVTVLADSQSHVDQYVIINQTYFCKYLYMGKNIYIHTYIYHFSEQGRQPFLSNLHNHRLGRTGQD